MKQIKQLFKSRNFRAALGMVVGTFLYSVGIVFILDLGSFFGGGVSGISQIISAILGYFDIKISMGIFVTLLNIPLFLIGWRGVSKRFAILTLGSVLLQTFFVLLLQFLDEKYSINPFKSFEGDMLTLAILGGLCCGFGVSIALKYGASTGGVDIISQYISFKKGINFTTVSFLIDALIILSALFFPKEVLGGIETCVYTFIRHIVSMLIVEKINTSYNMVKISIVTTLKEEMREALLKHSYHGITIYEAVGGFSNSSKFVFESIISRYELEEYQKVAHSVDENVFISITAIKGVDGRFTKKAIA